jgi:excisionase family DNA binding protein
MSEDLPTGDATASDQPLLSRLARDAHAEADANRDHPHETDTLTASFIAFLQAASRFDVFAFGPVNIYLPAVRAAARQALDEGRQLGGDYTRFTRLADEERKRSGASQLSELHVLLAFMKLGQGLPASVFGELGVSPQQVEEFARSGGVPPGELERLYSPEQAAAYLNVHVETIRDWIRTGRLRASRLAGRRALRIKASDLAAVLEPVEPPTDTTIDPTESLEGRA